MFPNFVIITGPELRHRYFVNHLNREFPISSVFIDSVPYPEIRFNNREEQTAWNWFFQRREKYENLTFAQSEEWAKKNKPSIFTLSPGDINAASTLTALKNLHPDLIILFDSSLIGPDILESFPDQILNLHLGISGEYRGSSCNFWPIHDRRLDCLGATLMKINAGIDTGEILSQGTIIVEEGDTEQSLMGKTLILGAEITIDTLYLWLRNSCSPLEKERRGKLFLKKDFKPDAINRVKEMVEEGSLKSLIGQRLKEQHRTI